MITTMCVVYSRAVCELWFGQTFSSLWSCLEEFWPSSLMCVLCTHKSENTFCQFVGRKNKKVLH